MPTSCGVSLTKYPVPRPGKETACSPESVPVLPGSPIEMGARLQAPGSAAKGPERGRSVMFRTGSQDAWFVLERARLGSLDESIRESPPSKMS